MCERAGLTARALRQCPEISAEISVADPLRLPQQPHPLNNQKTTPIFLHTKKTILHSRISRHMLQQTMTAPRDILPSTNGLFLSKADFFLFCITSAPAIADSPKMTTTEAQVAPSTQRVSFVSTYTMKSTSITPTRRIRAAPQPHRRRRIATRRINTTRNISTANDVYM